MTAPESTPGKSRWHLAMFGGMMLLLCAPVLTWALRIPELEGVSEMRPLANRPEWKTTPLARWASAIEAWANDHFPSRPRVAQWNGIVHHRWLGKPSSLVVVGRDDWLFYVGEKPCRICSVTIC
jgi:hypothetical protein